MTSFLPPRRARSNQLLILIDSKGRAYTLPAHELPSARGHGEPVTSKLDLQDGGTHGRCGDGRGGGQAACSAANNGYGFVGTLGDLQAQQTRRQGGGQRF